MSILSKYNSALSLHRVDNSPVTPGQMRRYDSLNTLEYTWDNDAASMVGYVFDINHEFDPFAIADIDITGLDDIVPVEFKYIINQSQTYSKDEVTYHLQFKPSFDLRNITDYYKENYIDRYNAVAPCGLYVLIPDVNGLFQRWIIVNKANGNDPMFPTYEILKCDRTLSYVYKGKIYDYAIVARSQNS